MQIPEFIDILKVRTGKSVQRSGTGYSCCCPAHDDQNPSLSVSEGKDGKILVNCFAGCSVEDICQSLNLQISDLFIEPVCNKPTSSKTIYSYRDEQGIELYRKIRLEPGINGKSKNFYSERTGENGETICNLQGCRRVLYNLPEVIQGISNGS